MWLSLLFPCRFAALGVTTISYSPSHTDNTHKNRLGFAISMTQSHLEFSIDCAQWPCKGPCGDAPTPPLWIRPHSDKSRCGRRLLPVTRRGCWRGLEYYFIGLFLCFQCKKTQSKAVTYLLGFFTSGDLRAKETFPEKTQRRAVFCRRSHGEESGSQVILLSQIHVILTCELGFNGFTAS